MDRCKSTRPVGLTAILCDVLELFLQQRHPVLDNGERSLHVVAGRDREQEPFAVGRHIPSLVGRAFKQDRGCADLEGRPFRGHRHSHHPAVRSEVEHFFAVAAPTGLRSAAVRDHPFPASALGGRERPDVDLQSSRFIRFVRDPVDIR